MLTTFERDEYIFEALHSGASGFILKNASPEDLIHAIRVIAEGNALLAPSVTRRIIEEYLKKPVTGKQTETLELLTERETEVLRLMARGKTNAEIAEDLYIGFDETAIGEPSEESIEFEEELGEPSAVAEEAEELDIAPALADSEEEEGLVLEDAPPEELEEKLEFFFGADEEQAEGEPVQEEAVEESAEAAVVEEESFDDLDIAPALAESPEEEGLDLGSDAELDMEGTAEEDEAEPKVHEGEGEGVRSSALQETLDLKTLVDRL